MRQRCRLKKFRLASLFFWQFPDGAEEEYGWQSAIASL